MSDVVLSASFPSADERGMAVAPYHPADIALAVAAIAEGVLRSGSVLAFGAHPTISPLVLHTARLLEAGPQVAIYQSDYYKDLTAPEIRQLVDQLGAGFHPTPDTGDGQSSRSLMREAMFGARPKATFFVGGMDGLDEEFALAGRVQSTRFLMVEPGGRTAQIARSLTSAMSQGGSVVALRGRGYGSLVLEAMERVGLTVTGVTGPYESEMYREPQDWEDLQ